MSDEPVFLSVAQVTALHRFALQEHGGQDGLRDGAAFESAVLHPRKIWFYAQGDLFDVEAAYAFHLSQSQAFLDFRRRFSAREGAALQSAGLYNGRIGPISLQCLVQKVLEFERTASQTSLSPGIFALWAIIRDAWAADPIDFRPTLLGSRESHPALMISRRMNAWLAALLALIGLQKLSARPPSGWITGIHPVSTGTIYLRLRLPSEGAGTFDLTDGRLHELN